MIYINAQEKVEQISLIPAKDLSEKTSIEKKNRTINIAKSTLVDLII